MPANLKLVELVKTHRAQALGAAKNAEHFANEAVTLKAMADSQYAGLTDEEKGLVDGKKAPPPTPTPPAK